jgi:hypothetical protein
MVRRIELLVLLGVFCGFLMVPTASFAEKKSALKDAEGMTYYTAVNIWFEDPKEIPSTNYHKGVILPINSQVTINSVRKNTITFTDENKIPYTIQIVRKHTPIPNEEIFKRYFSEAKVDLGKFSDEERKNILTGTIAVGMSKDAVIAAYGYPPPHVTPSLEGNLWKYWESRFGNFTVMFNKDGKVLHVLDK